MRALVLAAGKSTRIHPVSQGLPKPLIQVAGETILARNLRWLARQGVTEAWINLHYQPEVIRAAVGDGAQFGLRIQYSEEPEILGTAGAVKKLESVWDGPFVVLYGDNLISTDLAQMEAAHRKSGALCTVALFDRNLHPHTGIAGGRVRLQGERIVAFLEGVADEVSPLVNAGVYVVEPALLAQIPPATFYDFGKDVFPALLEANRPLWGHLISGYCLGIDTPESYQRALELIADKKVELE